MISNVFVEVSVNVILKKKLTYNDTQSLSLKVKNYR